MMREDWIGLSVFLAFIACVALLIGGVLYFTPKNEYRVYHDAEMHVTCIETGHEVFTCRKD